MLGYFAAQKCIIYGAIHAETPRQISYISYIVARIVARNK